MSKPFTDEEIEFAMNKMKESAKKYGIWNKICNECNSIVGGRLAEYGEPTDSDLQYICCPNCDNSYEKPNSLGFRVEFLQE